MTMWEINEAARVITESIDRDAKVIFGAVHDEKLKKGEIKITVIATGFNSSQNLRLPLNKEEETQNKKQVALGQGEEIEWDTVPAFLRRKVK